MAWINSRELPTNGHSAAASNGAPHNVASTSTASEPWFLALKRELHQQVISAMDLSSIGTMAEGRLRLEVRRQAEALCQRRADMLSMAERERLVNEVLDETFGLGPLEPLICDTTVSDILINGPRTVYVERRGRWKRPPSLFTTTGTCCR